MYGVSRTSSFGFTMKPFTYGRDDADGKKADGRGHDRRDQPSKLGRGDRVDERDRRTEDERAGDDEQAGEPDVRIGVRHAAEDGTAAIVEELLEPAEIDAHGQHQQHDSQRQTTSPARDRVSLARARLRRRVPLVITTKKPATAPANTPSVSSHPTTISHAGRVNR